MSKPFTDEEIKFIDEFLEQYDGLMKDLAKIEAAEKVHRHEGESTADCVSRGIQTLIGEGYDQEQAAAIAYKMCGEKGACRCDDNCKKIKEN